MLVAAGRRNAMANGPAGEQRRQLVVAWRCGGPPGPPWPPVGHARRRKIPEGELFEVCTHFC